MSTNQITARLLSEMRRAYDLVEQRQAEEAVAVYRELVADARKAGLDSAHLHWAYAVGCDYSGDLEMAFEQVSIAIAKDSFAPPFRNSFGLVTGRIRAALAAAAGDDATAEAARLEAMSLGEPGPAFAIPGPASA